MKDKINGEPADISANNCWNDHLQAIQSLIHRFRERGSRQEFLNEVVRLIQQISGCSAVGIRVLDENGYIPYQAYVGFNDQFWEAENKLQISKEDCSCTRLVSGTLLPLDEPIINSAGSLCCNDTLAFAETLSAWEREKYRGACNHAGYQTIGIMPIYFQNCILGLIHIADPMPAQLSPAVVTFVETVAPLVGQVLGRAQIEQSLKTSQDKAAIMERIVGGISSLAYVVDLDSHELIYISEELAEVYSDKLASRKCYEFFDLSAPCCDCFKLQAANGKSGIWERYDSCRKRHYFAERKEIQWPDGRTMNVAFISDITKQRQAENDLRESNAHLEKMVADLQQLSATLEEEIMERQAAQAALGQKAEEIERLAYYDLLTGLPNWARLNKLLEAELNEAAGGQPAGALLVIDLDDIKIINDTFGHTYGNSLITIAGQRIVHEAGSGAVVGRSGGDEFFVLAPGQTKRLISQLADKIIAAFCQEIEVLGIRFHMSASAGIACYPADGATAEEIFKNADNAMYAAKKAGKNCWRFYQAAMQAEAYERIRLTNSLRHAIDRGELLLYYQPQASIANGGITGFEALLRWNSPEYGAVSPERFIPLAEQSGLIRPIGQWVLQEACKFARRLADRGWTNHKIAVNVSPHQIGADGFITVVRKALSNAGIKPGQLELEITENALIASLEDSISKLDELQAMGVQLSLDDFGTGYSSLTYLQRLPVNTLKIDKAFIDMILMDGAQKAIIGSIVDIAHIMGMTVVAEGVETQRQLSYLAQCRCDRIQGYLLSRPVPAAEAAVFPGTVNLSEL